jgi:hypothetical protein
MISYEVWQHWHISGVATHKMIDPRQDKTSSHTVTHGHAVVLTVAEQKVWDTRQGAESDHEEQKTHRINAWNKRSPSA